MALPYPMLHVPRHHVGMTTGGTGTTMPRPRFRGGDTRRIVLAVDAPAMRRGTFVMQGIDVGTTLEESDNGT